MVLGGHCLRAGRGTPHPSASLTPSPQGEGFGACHSATRTPRGEGLRGAAVGEKTPTVAGASGRGSLRAGERRHSPFIRQRRQKAMPARIRRKSQLSIAREGFLDRRSKRCFWLLLSPQTKVARAGARNYPHRRQRKRSRRGAKLPPSETNTTLTPLRGDASSAPFGGTCLPAGRSVRGSDTPPACHSTPRTPQGEGLRGAAAGAKNVYRGWGKRPRQPPRR